MKTLYFSVAVLLVSVSEWVHAEKLTLAHVAVNPSQGIFWVAKDSGILAAIHYVKTNKAGTIRIFQKYMCGLSEEDLSTWLDDFREGLRSVPYPDEEALRAELDQIGAPKSQSPAAFLNTTFLDELKKKGFVDKLYR
jgi:hypothetical protein